jgi:hypothetical protein
LENANVAVSAAPLGIVAGVQFAAAFHFPEPGFALQVALPAKLLFAVKSRSVRMAAAEGRKVHERGP